MEVTTLRLYLLHLFASLAVWLATYYPGLDMVLSLLYLYLLYREGQMCSLNLINRWLVGFLWQAPALVFAIFSTGLFHFGAANYGIFLLSFWATPLLPSFPWLPSVPGFSSLFSITFTYPHLAHAVLGLCLPWIKNQSQSFLTTHVTAYRLSKDRNGLILTAGSYI